MNKPDIVPEKWAFFKRVLPRWLVVLALGFQTAIVAVLFVLSILFTVTFKRANSQLGSITEQVDYHFGMPSIAFVLGTVMLCALFVLLALGFSKLPRRWVFAALLVYTIVLQIIWLTSLSLVTYTYPDSDGCCGCLA